MGVLEGRSFSFSFLSLILSSSNRIKIPPFSFSFLLMGVWAKRWSLANACLERLMSMVMATGRGWQKGYVKNWETVMSPGRHSDFGQRRTPGCS
jgi:hypothetical protein